MKQNILIICVMMISGFTSFAQNKNRYTLQEAIELSIKNNIVVRQSGLVLETAELNNKQANNNRLPVANAELNYGVSSGRSIDPFTNSYINQRLSSSNGSMVVEVPVFNGFRTQNLIRQTRSEYEAARLENQQEKDNLQLNVVLAFLQVLNNEDILAQTRQQSLLTQEQVKRLEILNKEGAISPAVLFDIKGEYASDQVAIVNAANALETAKLTLAQFMNIPYQKELTFDREGLDLAMPAFTVSSEDIYNTAIQTLATVKATEFRKQAAANAVKVAAAARYPVLSLFGQMYTNYSSAAKNFIATGSNDQPTGDFVVINGTNVPVITNQTNFKDQKINYTDQFKNNLSTFAGINLRVPIFNSFRNKTNINLARVQEKNAGLLADDVKIRLKQAIEQAYVGMTSAAERYKIITDQVAAYEESFRAAEIRFNLGAINSVEYLTVKNNLDRARINLTLAKYEYLLRGRVLDFYIGK